MVTFRLLYDSFLNSISGSTLVKLSDEELEAELFNFAKKAIADFKFPNIPLTYEIVTEDDGSEVPYFLEEVTQKEMNVLEAYMKLAWIRYIISKEERFQNQYYDSSIRTFSAANLLAQLNRLYENFRDDAALASYNYGRVNSNGRPRLGDIN